MYKNIFFDNAPDMMAVLAVGGKFLECNNECTNILGYSKEDLLNMESCYDIFTPESVPRALAAREYMTRGESLKNLELRLIKKDKTVIDVLCNLAPFEDKKNNCFRTLAAWRESTDLVNERKKLEQYNENLTLFIQTISHDINGSLRRIYSLSSLLKEKSKSLQIDEAQKICTSISHNTEILNRYFEDIRMYFIGSMALKYEEVNTKDMIYNVLSYIDIAEKFNVQILSSMPTFFTLRIHLQQVFYNIISNAIAHHRNPESGSIIITAQEVDQMYNFSITNNEEYLCENDQEKILQRFNDLTYNEKSSMGLSIVRRILDQVGGSLYISSEKMGSNTFRFTWPTNL